MAPYAGTGRTEYLVYWWNADQNAAKGTPKTGRCLFLPSDMDPDSAKIRFTADKAVTIDGMKVKSGQNASLLTEGEHTLVCGERKYKLTVFKSDGNPAVFIDTESGSLEYLHQLFADDPEKENKEGFTCNVMPALNAKARMNSSTISVDIMPI